MNICPICNKNHRTKNGARNCKEKIRITYSIHCWHPKYTGHGIVNKEIEMLEKLFSEYYENLK